MNTDNNGSDNGWHDSSGRFTKNNPGKPKGSTKNKLRDKIKTFINDNWESLPGWFEKLKPKEKIEVMLSLMPYAVSRLQSVSMTDTEGNDVPGATIDFTLLDLPEDVLKKVLAATTIKHEDN
jgi:hypothetical protein